MTREEKRAGLVSALEEAIKLEEAIALEYENAKRAESEAESTGCWAAS